MSYASVGHYRIAKQSENVIVFNIFKGSCIMLDPLSYEVFKYIEKHTPDIGSILEFSYQKGIIKSEIQRLLQCLEECGFIYENSNVKE